MSPHWNENRRKLDGIEALGFQAVFSSMVPHRVNRTVAPGTSLSTVPNRLETKGRSWFLLLSWRQIDVLQQLLKTRHPA